MALEGMIPDSTIPPARFLYNNKEFEAVGGVYFFGARLYVPVIGRWAGVDPLAEKYAAYSPYNYVLNNPISLIDPDGAEGIVVSGQPGDHQNKNHFLVNGLDRAKKLVRQYAKEGSEEQVTWIIYNNGDPSNGGYTTKQIAKYKSAAAKSGINVVVVSDSDDIIDYVNEKNGSNSRSDDLISDFYYVGHALPGELSVGYISHDILDEWFNDDQLHPSDFTKDAFSKDSDANLVGGCRTCVNPWGLRDSAAEQMAQKVGGKVKGSDVRVFYPGGVVSEEALVKPNKGNVVTIKGTGGVKKKKG